MNNPFTTAPEVIEDADYAEVSSLELEIRQYRRQFGMMTPFLVGQVLGVTEDTLKEWRRGNNAGPPYIKVGRAVWYLYRDVQNWLYHGGHHDRQEAYTTPRQSPQERAEAGLPEDDAA